MNIVLPLAATAGYLAHQLRGHTERFANGWASMARHVIGVVCVFPFALLVFKETEGAQPAARFTAAYFLAFLFFGIGNAIGWAARGRT